MRWIVGVVCFVLFVSTLLISGAAEKASDYVLVKARIKPDRPWKEYKTRTVDQLKGYTAGVGNSGLSRYGGCLQKRDRGNGFFSAKKIGNRWWLVDPDGYLFIHVGVCSVRPGRSKTNQNAFEKKFGAEKAWAEQTTELLRKYGFNGLGSWSEEQQLRNVKQPLIYTRKWSFMGSFGRSKRMTHQRPGHLGYPDDCIPVFHPEFPTFCDEYAKSLASTKDDPCLLGHFSDNELPAPRNLLDKYLSLDASDPDLAPGYRAARAWLAKRKGQGATKGDVTDEDREAFRGYVYDRYFEITTHAMKKYDPNHLMLGPRLHGSAKSSPAIVQAAGKHLDVIAVNYYGAWGPDRQTMENWERWSGKPMMVTEFYTKGADADPRLTNRSGAGWIVETQQDRGRFYQHFVLGLLESRTCVGWHWFKYMDNDPDYTKTDPSNRDSNKGIVTIRYDEYTPLLENMRRVNGELYTIVEHLDSQ